jgi:hypothetical protein
VNPVLLARAAQSYDTIHYKNLLNL